LKNPGFAERVSAKLRDAWPKCLVMRLERPAVWGAVILAQQAAAPTQAAAPLLAATTSANEGGQAHADWIQWRPVSASPTEGRHPRSSRFAEMPLAEAIRLMLEEDATIPGKILAESERIEWTVRPVVRAFAEGG